MRILLAEDERELNKILTKQLAGENYSVDSCFDGLEALDALALVEYDLIIMDIMMPRIDGLEVLRRLREKNNKTPVLLLTARNSLEDKVRGLDIGADDYLPKPFELDELMARVRAMIRRGSGNAHNILSLADLTLNCATRQVRRGEQDIVLSNKEFAVLEYLVRNTNIVLSREKIENHVWNFDYEGGTNVVDVYIRYLRKKIDEGFIPKLLHTIRGVGYVARIKE